MLRRIHRIPKYWAHNFMLFPLLVSFLNTDRVKINFIKKHSDIDDLWRTMYGTCPLLIPSLIMHICSIHVKLPQCVWSMSCALTNVILRNTLLIRLLRWTAKSFLSLRSNILRSDTTHPRKRINMRYMLMKLLARFSKTFKGLFELATRQELNHWVLPS